MFARAVLGGGPMRGQNYGGVWLPGTAIGAGHCGVWLPKDVIGGKGLNKRQRLGYDFHVFDAGIGYGFRELINPLIRRRCERPFISLSLIMRQLLFVSLHHTAQLIPMFFVLC